MSSMPRTEPAPRQSPEEDQARVAPPFWLLGVALVSVLSSVALLFSGGRFIDLVGYVLATMITVLAVGGFRSIDARRQGQPSYVLPRFAQMISPKLVCAFLLVAGFLVGAVHVWRFADVVARG